MKITKDGIKKQASVFAASGIGSIKDWSEQRVYGL